jgi:hypothetical protein
VLREIARSIRTMFELLPSVIRRSTVQKKCQEGVNTRENASSRRAAYVYHDARAHPQSIVLAGSFRSCSFLLPEISQTCSQLIHTSFMAALASGLETRNQLRKRQEKNEFYFRLRPKKFLDWENEARVSSQNQETVCSKISRTSPRDSESPQRTDFAANRLRIPS